MNSVELECLNFKPQTGFFYQVTKVSLLYTTVVSQALTISKFVYNVTIQYYHQNFLILLYTQQEMVQNNFLDIFTL